ncbi:hypothetical protein [Pseudomonas sp. CC6-YY-74]|uniref:hypothetical protein n=1 Tax=Pseudomonas sp. CC6-YY-74 TaxID=1930532 RepID=UPI0012AB64EE|nr:hypothetical protein [Pseudomonas sp. CC6-YY-74]
MIHRASLPIIAALLIAGCASAPRYSGSSVTDQVLRQDIYKNVSLLFKAQHSCYNIETINTEITNLVNSESGAIIKANELWKVGGCNKFSSYKVELTADSNGETYYSVGGVK